MSGIYVHIPFCHSKCSYCDFFSSPNRKDENTIIKGIIAEYKNRHREIENPSTLYIGGGTPSILSDDNIAEIMQALPVEGMKEVTIEANPEDVTEAKACFWRSIGINRVSMGVQTFVDSELKIIGRRHSAADAIHAVENIRRGGIDNFNLDLIYGLPGQTTESWRFSLNGLLELSPSHFSAYMLTYEPRTRLMAMLRSGKIKALSEEDTVEMYNILIHEALKYGYEHYEISNFARPGFRAIHNSGYWHSVPYIGLGPSAHSFDGICRRVNPSSISAYISNIEERGVAYEIEEESKNDIFNDTVITALRTSEGLPFANVPRRRLCKFLCDAFPYLQSGDLVVKDSNLIIPEARWLISDSIMRDLIQ